MLLDATGRVVQRIILDSERATFDSSSLVRGVYAFQGAIAPAGASVAMGTWVRE